MPYPPTYGPEPTEALQLMTAPDWKSRIPFLLSLSRLPWRRWSPCRSNAGDSERSTATSSLHHVMGQSRPSWKDSYYSIHQSLPFSALLKLHYVRPSIPSSLLGGKKRSLNFHGKRIHLLPSEVHEAFSRAQKARAKSLHGQLATCSLLQHVSCRAARGTKKQIEKLKKKVKRLKRENRALERELELWKEAREHACERGDFFRRLSKRTVEKLRDAEHEWAEAKKNGEDARKALRLLSTVVKKYRRNLGARNVPPTPPAPHTTPVTPTSPTSPTVPTSPTSPVSHEPLG
ncbi:hypothetical protein BGX38DRAFT_1146338, partial [Terfezia claveryi]